MGCSNADGGFDAERTDEGKDYLFIELSTFYLTTESKT